MNDTRGKMGRLGSGLLVLVLVLTMVPWAALPALAAPTELFFSEYVEGSSFNKALEIYNGTGAAVDLSIYTLELYSNGASSPSQTTALSGTVADGDVFVIAHPSADAAILAEADATNGSVVNFNGDDAVVLKNAGTVADVIGQVGFDPGSYWGSGNVTTQNHTLRRKGTIETGDTDGSNPFDPAVEWDGYPVDTFDGLGSHSIGGGPEYTPIYDIQYTSDPSGDSPYIDQEVTTEGIVTAVFYYGYFIEGPAGGAWNGLWVYDGNAPILGDRVRLTGTVDEYYNLTELADLTFYAVESSGNPLPDPVVVTTGAANDEQYEGVLIRVENVEVTAEEDSYYEWEVDDGSGPLAVDNLGSDTYNPVLGDELVAVIGPLNYDYGAFKIAPRDDNDIVLAEPEYTPIYDIQYTSDPSGDSPYIDQEVTTEGIVTAVFYNGYFIEDPAGGPWNGLWVYDGNAPNLGDRVRLTGTVDEYYNLTELADLTFYAVESSGNPLPDPVVVTTSAADDEQYESVLIRVENVEVTAEEDSFSEWEVDDGSGPLAVDNLGADTYVPVLGDELVAVIGPLNYSYGAFKIAPRDDGDILFPVPPSALIINEIHADPASGLAGDANGDGTRDGSQDEFVEIVNTAETDVNISGWTLSDEYGVRHTFPSGTTVPANCAIVVFGGGTPTGAFGGVVVQTASSGQVGLNNGGDTVTLNDGAADVATETYGSEGGDNQSLTRDPDITGTFVKHTTATGSGGALFSPGTMVDGTEFAGCVMPGDKIHDIQGDGSASPVVGSTVTIEGIVVGDFQHNAQPGNGDLRGFHVQEEDADADGDPLTSEGVFVYDGYSPAVDVMVGDLVRVTGEVSEYSGLTEIGNLTEVTVLSSDNDLPTPATVTLPPSAIADLEAYEGMSVTFPQALYISEYYNFDYRGEIVLTSARQNQPTAVVEPGPDAVALAAANLLDSITLDDGRTSSNPDPAIHPNGDVFDLSNLFRGGDTVQNVTGVLDYSFGLYRIQPTQGADYNLPGNPSNPRTAEPDDVGGGLKVASFNVLNYFTTIDTGAWICGPSGDMECRGADDSNEFTRQRDKIIAALTAIDADVVGLIEIENYPGDVPTADLVQGINDVLGAGTYDYIATGAIGTDAIRQAFIYKPATVTALGDYAVLDSSVDSRFLDDYNRPVLAQTFQDNTTGGIFTVAVNHLKSKGSACDAIGDPDTGDGSGNCNLTRMHAAEALVDWLATDPTGSGDADFLIIGDLNSYDKEDPIDVLLAGGYTDLIYNFLGEYAYSYVFDRQVGYLDHGLANPELMDEVTGTTVWHINADEPDLIDYDTSNKEPAQAAIYAPDAYRSSDHDPVIVGLGVCDEIPPAVTVSASPDMLWPANHKYVEVVATVEVEDFDPNPTIELVSVTSSEADEGLGDGDTPIDIVIGEDGYTFQLRAERSALGEGRVYTITYLVTDACGNSTEASVMVTVPHDKGKKD